MTTQSAAVAGCRAATSRLTASALACASAPTTVSGAARAPSAAATASSSTPETTTTGSIPALRSTVSRPVEADPSTTRVMNPA